MVGIQREKSEGVCWLVGGGEIVSYFLQNKLIDEVRLFTIPILLGKGINLFNKVNSENKVELIDNNQYKSGVIEAVYQVL